MRLARPYLLTGIILAGLGLGAVKMIEEPGLVATFAAAGLAPAALSLYGALQLFCALLLILPRTRIAAGLLLAASFAFSAQMTLQQGAWIIAALPLLLVPMTLIAVFWRVRTGRG